ncbi:hypothetical protein [Maridesulfovibrio sp.]|uniref:hypothetical protein n=1 Tax=Maridesulfovibrio sp. TaxID=2795000 RepID=UPI0029F59E81|nr:hypothetical protein [Maridesulfovibrio sp.]
MKKIFTLFICSLLLLGFTACAKKFEHAQSAKTSMHDVGESAGELKDETETAKSKTEEIKDKESLDSLEGHKW